MLEWFRKRFARPTPEPRFVDVGKATITIQVNDGRVFETVFVGERIGDLPMGGGDWIMDAQDIVRAWQERCGKTGTVRCGEELYVPLCNIKDMRIVYSEHKVEVA